MDSIVIERESFRDGVVMALKNESLDKDYYEENHDLNPNKNWDNDEECEYNDESSYSCNKSQDMEIARDVYWQSQESLLQEILDRHHSTGFDVKQEITWVIETTRETSKCVCISPKMNNCGKCLRQKVVNALRDKGLCASLSTSKWRHTSKLQGGTHEYIEVIESTQTKRSQVHLIIELSFRDEFKMAKACNEYHNLINQIPKNFIGKYNHLNAIVRLLCDVANKSAWEKKIHIGPWRKRSFMLKKWSNSQLLNQKSSNNKQLLNEKSSTKEMNMPLVSGYLQFSSSSNAVKVK